MNGFDLISRKAEAIYKENPDTPLFAIVAENRFKADNSEEAKKIIERGLSVFPEYASAHYLYAKILVAEGEKEKAKEILEKAETFFVSEKLDDYFDKILADESGLLGKLDADPILQELNEEILPEKNDVAETEPDEFVSETLATVYENQGATEEAIEIYEKLIEKEPENAQKYAAKIEELKKKA